MPERRPREYIKEIRTPYSGVMNVRYSGLSTPTTTISASPPTIAANRLRFAGLRREKASDPHWMGGIAIISISLDFATSLINAPRLSCGL